MLVRKPKNGQFVPTGGISLCFQGLFAQKLTYTHRLARCDDVQAISVHFRTGARGVNKAGVNCITDKCIMIVARSTTENSFFFLRTPPQTGRPRGPEVYGGGTEWSLQEIPTSPSFAINSRHTSDVWFSLIALTQVSQSTHGISVSLSASSRTPPVGQSRY